MDGERHQQRDLGFTLAEIVAVIVILVVLAAVVLFTVRGVGGPVAVSACADGPMPRFPRCTRPIG